MTASGFPRRLGARCVTVGKDAGGEGVVVWAGARGRDDGGGTHSRTRKYALSVFRSRVRCATGYRTASVGTTASIVDPRASRHRKWGASAGDFIYIFYKPKTSTPQSVTPRGWRPRRRRSRGEPPTPRSPRAPAHARYAGIASPSARTPQRRMPPQATATTWTMETWRTTPPR